MSRSAEPLVEAHEEAALAATLMTGLLGLFAGLGWWRLRRGSVGRGWLASAMALALATTLALGWVAMLGGRISHPEIRPAVPVGTAAVPVDH